MPNIKLSKIAKELNVGLGTIVDFMHENGYKDFEMNPNARLTDEQVDLLNKEFNKDKSTRSTFCRYLLPLVKSNWGAKHANI